MFPKYKRLFKPLSSKLQTDDAGIINQNQEFIFCLFISHYLSHRFIIRANVNHGIFNALQYLASMQSVVYLFSDPCFNMISLKAIIIIEKSPPIYFIIKHFLFVIHSYME